MFEMLEETATTVKGFFATLPPWVYAVALGAIASFWRQFKGFFRYLSSFIICYRSFDISVRSDDGNIIFYSVLKYLGFRPSLFLKKDYFLQNYPFQSQEGMVLPTVGLSEISSSLYWKGIIPFWINGRGKKKNNDDSKDADSSSQKTIINVRYFRGTIDFEKIILEIESFLAKEFLQTIKETKNVAFTFRINYATGSLGSSNFDEVASPSGGNKANYIEHGAAPFPEHQMIYLKQHDMPLPLRLLTRDVDDLGYVHSDVVRDSYYYRNDKEQVVVDEIKKWLSHRDWFKKRLIPYKRGYLLHGNPGTGKTSFIRELARELGLSVVIWNLSTFTNREFEGEWRRRQGGELVVANVIEDIDGSFNMRDNLNKSMHGDHLMFNTLLNSIDGVEIESGSLLFITTNHKEHVDPALSETRPGRIDAALEFGNIDNNGKRHITSKILKGYPNYIEALLVDTRYGLDKSGITNTEFVEQCTKKAFEIWGEEEEVG